MKILHIRFCNLNSLGGSWFIDLTSPEYTSDGIFTITGPTGAGKTTILDAVCLALYGRTPRLKQVSRSTNEIMTRQTGVCWSEVEFSTSKGRYRCHWSQHRARKAAEGDLQQPRHEIINCANGQPLETKMKMVAQKVVDVIGMTYDQFTRSILLAQGDFNTFLKANPDERAPILEQITGTEVYSRISRKVHERKSEELLRTEQLSKECDGFTPLSKERLAEITARRAELAHKTATAEKSIIHSQMLLDWYRGQDKLRQEIDIRTKQLADHIQQWEAMEPQRQRLARAEKAKLFETGYSHLAEQRTLQEKESGEHAASALQLQHLIKEVQEKTVAESRVRETLFRTKDEVKAQETILRQVRSLDQQLSTLKDQHSDINSECAAELKRKLEIEQAIAQGNQQLQTIEEHLNALSSYRQEYRDDHRLVEEFSGIRQQIEHVIELHKKHAVTIAQLPTLQKGITELEGCITGKKVQTTALDASRQKLDLDEREITQRLAKLLDGQSSEQLFAGESRAQERLFQLEQATTLARQLAGATLEHNELTAQEQVLDERLKVLQESRLRATEELELRKDTVDKQQRIVQLANRIKDYEQERKQLREGDPCPLCGSLNHPYSSDSGPAVTTEQSHLEAEVALLDKVREKLAAIQTAQAAAHAHKEQLTRIKKEKEKNREATAAALSTICTQLALKQDEQLQDRLAERHAELSREREQLRLTRSQIETLKTQLNEAGTTRTNLTRETAAAERELQKLLHDQEKLQTQLEQQSTEQLQYEKDLAQRRHQLGQRLAPYTHQQLPPTDYSHLMEQLETRRKRWLWSEEQHQAFSLQIKEKRAELASHQLLLENQLKISSEKHGRLERLTVALTNLLEQRRQLFGDQDPDTVERRLLERVEKEEITALESNKLLSSLQQKHAALTERVETQEKRITERTMQLQDLTNTFTAAIIEAGFMDEKDFLESRLDAQRYLDISESIQQQRKAIDEIRALLNSSTATLDREQGKKLTDNAPADIHTLLSEQRKQHAALQQETGALNQQLRDNEQQRELHAEKLELLTTQRTELERWSRLHELIGSNDGKKFRNFAQGLTFEIMISHANTSLRKMSDRYLLVRDPAQPLELHVIDNYQGGEIRSTKNLSGGESFIVSMALALGLSGMASHNVQVDSLFLDEGFGTLDEESLQTALDTLASLHQEGKIIGVISHVSGLQERIATRIGVTRGLGGLSSISGPGTGKWHGSITV